MAAPPRTTAVDVTWEHDIGRVSLRAERDERGRDARTIWVRYHAREPRAPKTPRPRRHDELPTTPAFAEAVAAASPPHFRPWRIRAVAARLPVRLAVSPGPARAAVVRRTGPGAYTACSPNCGRAIPMIYTQTGRAPGKGSKPAVHEGRRWEAASSGHVTTTDADGDIVVARGMFVSFYSAGSWHDSSQDHWYSTPGLRADWTRAPERVASDSPLCRPAAGRPLWPGEAARLRAAAAAALGRRAALACATAGL